MIKNLTQSEHTIYIRVYGRHFKVMAIADNDDEANEFMRTHHDAACIAVQDDFVYIASKNDEGIEL